MGLDLPVRPHHVRELSGYGLLGAQAGDRGRVQQVTRSHSMGSLTEQTIALVVSDRPAAVLQPSATAWHLCAYANACPEWAVRSGNDRHADQVGHC